MRPVIEKGSSNGIIPAPVFFAPGAGSFSLAGATVSGELSAYTAGLLDLPVTDVGSIHLELGVSPAKGGYYLTVTQAGIRIEADATAGLFAGVQTLRQLASDGEVPVVRIEDHPRFEYRGAMLDVTRHFFSVADVKRYIDGIALLKLNFLHLQLTDDQGWRIEITSWPELTRTSATTQVGGNGGGFYSQQDYREIVEHAASRFVTIVPEIDMPGHTNAAIVAYPALGDVPAEPYEGIEVGFSSLAIRKEGTYAFVDDVIREVAALTPGPYLHIGGDESLATTEEDFLAFVERSSAIAAFYGKTPIGWHELGQSRRLPPGTIGQYWGFTTAQEGAADLARSFVEQGGQIIMSPADVAYLDIKYDEDSPHGLDWANGPTSVRQAYEWDPASIVPGIGDEHVLGVEAPIWTETMSTIDQVEFMSFPRLAAIAEIAWSPRAGRTWNDFEQRLAWLGRVWDAAGTRFYRAPGIPWHD